MSLRIVRLAERLFNTHGDVENSRPLALRAKERGHRVEVVSFEGGRWSGKAPSVVVIGSAMEFQWNQALATLRSEWSRLQEWQASGTVLVAVGTSVEMLGRTVQRGGEVIEGLGAHTGSAEALPTHQSRFVVVHHERGEAVGFLNRDRRMVWDSTAPVGVITAPDDLDGDQDLFLSDTLVMTALRGPVLAVNPWIADEVLARCGVDTSGDLPDTLRRLDAHSDAVASRIRSQLQAN